MTRNSIRASRDKPGPNQPYGPWQQSQAALDTETFPQATPEVAGLTNQPQGIDLEYRIVAVNSAGTSVPSNTTACVL